MKRFLDVQEKEELTIIPGKMFAINYPPLPMSAIHVAMRSQMDFATCALVIVITTTTVKVT